DGTGVSDGPSSSTSGNGAGGGCVFCWGTAVVKMEPCGAERGTLGRKTRESSPLFTIVGTLGPPALLLGPVGNGAGGGASRTVAPARGNAPASKRGGSAVLNGAWPWGSTLAAEE